MFGMIAATRVASAATRLGGRATRQCARPLPRDTTSIANNQLASARRSFNTRLQPPKSHRDSNVPHTTTTSRSRGNEGIGSGHSPTFYRVIQNEGRWALIILTFGGLGVLAYQKTDYSPGFRERSCADLIARARSFEDRGMLLLARHAFQEALDITHSDNAKLQLSYKLAFMQEDISEQEEAERLFTVAAEMAGGEIKSISKVEHEDGEDLSLGARRRRVVSRDRLAQYSHDKGQHTRAENLYTSALDAACTAAEFIRDTDTSTPVKAPKATRWWGSSEPKEKKANEKDTSDNNNNQNVINNTVFAGAGRTGGGVGALADEVAGVLNNMANLYAETGRLDDALGVLAKFKTVCTRFQVKNRSERMAQADKFIQEIHEAKKNSLKG